MTERNTDYGRLCVGSKEELFAGAVALAAAQQTKAAAKVFTWALTGGQTPIEWYGWCVRTHALPASLLAATHFTVSDERHVPLTSDQSNFGHAVRGLLDPLGVPSAQCHPWPVRPVSAVAAEAYRSAWTALAGAGRAYDVCFLGLGEDAHTASIFPGSPLLASAALAKEDEQILFTALDTAKGPRLTITPAGLRACGLIVIMTLGEEKAPALKRIFSGPYDPLNAPAQILKTCANRTVWLADEAAAKEI
jgi:6-phosphogluconolactonase